MAEKRRGKKRKEEFPEKEEKVEKPSKDEYTIAKWIKENVPNKKTKFLGHNVQYFTGLKAVDALMESKFGKPEKEGMEPFFTSREHCVDFLDIMLRHKFFHRAKKVLQDKIEDIRKKKVKEGGGKKEEDKKRDKRDKDQDSQTEGGKKSEADCEDDSKKMKKKKVKLEMHLEQIFVDSRDAYVWIYDPIPIYYPIIGTLVVLAAIVVCLFPLWPSSVRSIVYYLSVAAACFLVFIIALALLRSILFCIIWLVTLGKHHLWILPNLTEDVGFFASFWPLYQYEYKGPGSKTTKSKKSKKKLKDSDDEENCDDAPDDGGATTANDDDENNAKSTDDNKSQTEEEEQGTSREEMRGGGGQGDGIGGGGEGSDSEGSGSQTGKDFEILDKEELNDN